MSVSVTRAEVYEVGRTTFGRVHLKFSDLAEPVILDGWTIRRRVVDGRMGVYAPVMRSGGQNIRTTYVGDELYGPIRDALLAKVPEAAE